MLARSTLLLSTAGTGSGRHRQRRAVGNGRAYDGIDNAAMGIQLSLNDPYKSRRSGDFTDQQQQQQQQPPLYADYRRRSLTADSDATSIGRGRGDTRLPSTTPVGSYINGVLGGSLHPGLADDLDDDDAEEAAGRREAAAAAAAPADEDAKSLAESAGEAVVRLRAETARLTERLRAAEQRLRQSELERRELAERLATTSDELDEVRHELRAERQLTAELKRQRETQRADEAGSRNPRSPTSQSGSSLDVELDRANQRASSLERSLQELQRRLLLAEGQQASRSGTAVPEDAEPEAPLSAGPAAALAIGAMSQAVADLRAEAEALRRRAARDELARKQRLEEVEERAADSERANEEALLSVSLGLESAKAQNSQLRRLLERNEAERAGQSRRLGKLQEQLGQLQETHSGLEAWAGQVAAGREDLRQLGAANGELRDRLARLEASLAGLGAELQAAQAEAARRNERCRRLADEAKRARQAEAKSSRTAAAASATLGRVAADNRALRRRLVAAADAAESDGSAKLARQLRELAETLRTDFQVPELRSSGTASQHQQPHQQSLQLEIVELDAELQASQRAKRQLQSEVTKLRRELQMAIEKLTECEAQLYLAREVASSESDSGLGDTAEPRRRSNAQLAALIEQIDLVEARGDSLLALKRRQMQEAAAASSPSQSRQNQQRPGPPDVGGRSRPAPSPSEQDRSNTQRLLRMLLYNSGGFADNQQQG